MLSILFSTLVLSTNPFSEDDLCFAREVTPQDARTYLSIVRNLLGTPVDPTCKIQNIKMNLENPGHRSSYETDLRFDIQKTFSRQKFSVNTAVHFWDDEPPTRTTTLFLFDSERKFCGIYQTEVGIYGETLQQVNLRIIESHMSDPKFRLSIREVEGNDQIKYHCDSSE